MGRLEAAGITLVAISYDEPDALAAFARSHDITFPLLSDPDSEVIRRFGILNTLIAEDDHPWFGIPFPGVYVTDGDGVITAKFFESSLAKRPGVDQLIRAVAGEDVSAELIGQAPEDRTPDVACEVALDTSPTAAGIMRDLHVRLRVAPGRHVYGQPVPDGMVATSVEIESVPGLLVDSAITPPTRPHLLGGTGETLQVYDGDVELRVPFTHNRSAPRRGADASAEIRVAGRVRWQSCDDEACGLPAEQAFEFMLPIGPVNPPPRDPGPDDMDTRAFLDAMVARRG